jgi:transposase-like protein
LTKRQQEVLDRLERGMAVKEIARDIGVHRNAVYQHIERLRRQGAVAESYTASGQPPRRLEPGAGAVVGAAGPAVAPRDSGLPRLRELAHSGAATAGEPEYAHAIEAAIASRDAVGLAYELGRLDASGASGMPADLVESALRRLSVLPSDEDPATE